MAEIMDEMVNRLVDLNIVVIKDDGYDYTDDFKDSVRQYLKKPLGALAKVRLANKISKANTPIFWTLYKTDFRDKKSVELMNTVTLFFIYYVQSRKKDKVLKDKDLSNILYTMYCLDQQIPDIEV